MNLKTTEKLSPSENKSIAPKSFTIRVAEILLFRYRFVGLILAHIIAFVSCFLLAYGLRFDFQIPAIEYSVFAYGIVWVVLLKLGVFYLFNSFHGWWRYIAFSDLQSLAKSTIFSFVAVTVVDYLFFDSHVPRTVVAIDALLTFLVLGSVRSSWRLLNEEIKPRIFRSNRKRVLLVGTDHTVIRLGHQMRSLPSLGYDVVGFVSRYPESRKWYSNFRVLGNFDSMKVILSCYHVDEIMVPAGSLSGQDMRKLRDFCTDTQHTIKVVPSVEDLLNGSGRIPVREVDINDLLGRDPIVLDTGRIGALLKGQVVLVTGAGGSIGSEICRQIVGFQPKILLILGRGENRIFEIERELRDKMGETTLVALIGDINDEMRMRSIFELYAPAIVFHAAAHKHVPLMEANVGEAIKNNVFGTKNVADLAHEFCCSHFVLVSTDKAVNPTSVMGTTKHLAERYVLSRTGRSATKFVVVRFGNVLGSNGSVVPVFQEQIRKGGPITITDPRMKRFFMSIPEASQLVLQAASLGSGGEIFVLDMGEPVLISELAKDLIRLSGLSPDSIDIEYTGIRPGEKLYEELYFDEETSLPTDHKKIFAAYHRPFEHTEVLESFDMLKRVIDESTSREVILQTLKQLVPELNHFSNAHSVEQEATAP